jgi:hypothetical protein
MSYAVFTGDHYYPSGGWRDFKGVFEDLFDAYHCVRTSSGDWYQIVNLIDYTIEAEGQKA